MIRNAYPYQHDRMNLPVADLEAAIPFYQDRMGFQLLSRSTDPFNRAILERDGIQIGLSENGGDPSQDGCFFEVDDIQSAFDECKTRGLVQEGSVLGAQKNGHSEWRVFFIVAPDGLCYCFGEKI